MTTPNLGMTLPTVGADADTWGAELNTALTVVDTFAGTIGASGTWTPTDASGASLSLSSPVGFYRKTPGFIHVWGSLTYPSTADASNAKIGGLPQASANIAISTGFLGVIAYGTGSGEPGASVLENVAVNSNAATVSLYGGGFTNLKNADVSSRLLVFYATYPV